MPRPKPQGEVVGRGDGAVPPAGYNTPASGVKAITDAEGCPRAPLQILSSKEEMAVEALRRDGRGAGDGRL